MMSYRRLSWLESSVRLYLVAKIAVQVVHVCDSGSLHGDFEKVAYELEPSTTNNPKYAEVKTGHGYHIIVSCSISQEYVSVPPR